MAHGFAGTKHHGLERFAKAFCNAGFIVLVHDHRGFGTSGGELRQDVNPGQQIADWRRVVSYLEALPEVDPQRIGIWGTSYSGGHAIILAATDRRFRCAVSQAPLIDGFEQLRRCMSPSESLALDSYLLEDERAQFSGNPPLTTTIASADPNVSAIIRVQERLTSTCSLSRNTSGKTKSRFSRCDTLACTTQALGSRGSRRLLCFSLSRNRIF
jgi:pimeloyl-ACP methyl ester carboxylesterase